jgi:myo-inositol-1(or 4)-monophosphatase
MVDMTDERIDLEHRLVVARRAAEAAAAYLKDALWEPHQVKHKGIYDLSLTADVHAGGLIRALLEEEFPGEGVLEEDAEMPSAHGRVWIVDPLDGTVNYHHRLPWFCVSIACWQVDAPSDHPLWKWGRPLVSVVTAPLLNMEFYAWEGGGAWSGDRRLSVSPEPLNRGILSYSRGSALADQEFMKMFLSDIGPEARKTRSHGAAALDLAFVAQGSLVGHVQRTLQPWDVAAGVQLVLEAGGRVRIDAAGDGHHVVAAGPGAFTRLETALTAGAAP